MIIWFDLIWWPTAETAVAAAANALRLHCPLWMSIFISPAGHSRLPPPLPLLWSLLFLLAQEPASNKRERERGVDAAAADNVHAPTDCPSVTVRLCVRLCRLPLICRSNRTDWHCFACLAVCLSLSLCYFRLAPTTTTTTVFAFCWVSSHIYQSSIDWSTDCTAAAAVAGQWPHNSFFFILSFLFFPSVVIKDGCRQGWLKVNERDWM